MRILVAGDFCPSYRVIEKFENGNYPQVLGEVKPLLEQANYSIVNFECPVCYGGEIPIEKCGPNLRCTERGVESLKWVGFDCVTLANNHFLDYGEEGVRSTLSACAKYGLDTVGGGVNINKASSILYKEIDGKRLAIINCCEHEFSIASERTAGSNPLNPICQYYAIKEAKVNADYVLVIVHGGNEHFQLPSPRMQETYRFFVDTGADAVVNHHQHCYSGYEIYKKKPIFYGLGNFCFDDCNKRKTPWNEGYIVKLNLDKIVEFEIIPYIQCDNRPIVTLMKDEECHSFKTQIEVLNAVIADDVKLRASYTEYLDTTKKIIKSVFEPYSGKLALALYRRGLLPSFVTEKKKRLLLAYIQCESHISKILYYLKK